MDLLAESRPRNVDRLPRRPVGKARRGREIGLGILGVLALLVLEIGVPAALIKYVGYPLPRSAPSRDWLTASISATVIIKILACVVWLVWAHFTVCVLSEWRSMRRGRLPRRVLLGGGSQALARRLVAAALLLGGAATTFGGLASAHTARPPAVVSAMSKPPAEAHASTKRAHAERATSPAPQRHDTKYYVVEPPQGRHHDCLWDIAERTLGDPLRYKEIFALNKDRVQADGSRLVDANLIRPGWELRLPADAAGPGVHVVQAKAPAHPAGPAVKDTPPPAHPSSHGKPSIADGTIATTDARHGGSLDTTLLGGGLMLAGILLAVTARRGPYGEQTEDEQALGTLADLGLAAALDWALRHLAARRREQGRGLPQPIVAWVCADDVSLNLAGGDVADPPAPWTTGSDVQTWTCRLADVPATTDDGSPAPYPGLVSVGRHDGYELFVDFEQAPGLISIGGDIDRARELATGLAVQAVTSAWSDGARATLVGFADGDDLVRIDPRRLQHLPQIGSMLAEFEQEQKHVRELQRELGVDGVLSGRLAHRGAAWQPHFVVFSGQPSSAEITRLQALIGGGRSPFIAVVVGDTQSAHWRFVVDEEGNVDLGVLGAVARAHRLRRESIPALVEMLDQAAAQRAEQARSVPTLTPHSAAIAARGASAAHSARAVAEAPHSPDQLATVRISLLGPVHVQAAGPLHPARRELATEIAVALALHPDGLREEVLRASIWPRGVSDAVCTAALGEVTAWFGPGLDGRPAASCEEGVWQLGSSVAVDWDEMRRLAGVAAGPDELATLLRAVELFHGEAFSDTAPGRYSWLAFARAARDARVVGTAVTRRAAALLVAQRRTDEAERTLRRGLALVPAAESLWRDLMHLISPRGPEPVAMVADEMYAALDARRIWAEPETDALVQQLAPGYRSPRIA